MNLKTAVSTAAIAALTFATLVAAPMANAAKDPSRISAPTTAEVGEEITITSRFKAKQRKNRCFIPEITYGDESPGGFTFGSYMCGGGLLGGGKRKKFVNQKDEWTHTYTRPGTYTITVAAAYRKAPGGSLSGGSDGPATTNAPKKSVRGSRVVTHTITITSPDQFTVAPERRSAILTDGYRATTREEIVELVNALEWDTVWIDSLGVDSGNPPFAVDYYNVDSGEFLVARQNNDSGGVFTRWWPKPDSGITALERSSSLNIGASTSIPADSRVVSGGPGWTSGSTGEPIRMWLFSNGTQAASQPR